MAQSGLRFPPQPGSRSVFSQRLRGHRGRAVDCGEPEHVFGPHDEHRRDGPRTRAAALVLLDELGVDRSGRRRRARRRGHRHFKSRGALVVATTHYDALKSTRRPRRRRLAAFGFDPDTFAPTYRLIYGSPGRSLALEIAARLGLPASVIGRPRRGARRAKSSSPSTWRRWIRICTRSITNVASPRGNARHRFRRGAPSGPRGRPPSPRGSGQAADRGGSATASAKRSARSTISCTEFGAGGPARSRGAGRTRVDWRTGEMRSSAGSALDSDRHPCRPARSAPPAAAPAAVRAWRVPSVGDRVMAGPFGIEGTVQSIHDRDAEMDVRGKRSEFDSTNSRARSSLPPSIRRGRGARGPFSRVRPP